MNHHWKANIPITPLQDRLLNYILGDSLHDLPPVVLIDTSGLNTGFSISEVMKDAEGRIPLTCAENKLGGEAMGL